MDPSNNWVLYLSSYLSKDMLKIGIAIGIYSYVIFVLGIIGFLSYVPILITTVAFLVFIAWHSISSRKVILDSFIQKYTKIEVIALLLLMLLGLVNLIGALGPELAFDALWYHLTIPKLFIQAGEIAFLKESLFYYSLLPKLAEMLYIPALVLGNEIVAKFIHFSFGVATAFVVYRLSRLFMPRKESILASLLYYSNLVVAWLSITAYVDLSRSFFETLALFFVVKYLQEKEKKHLIASSVSLGFGICVKVVSLVSLPIFLCLLFLAKKNVVKKIQDGLIFALISIGIASPWFVYSFISSGNPIYPLFSSLGPTSLSYFNFSPIELIKNIISVMLFASDPINPIYLISIPLIIANANNKKIRNLLIYSGVGFAVWYIVSFGGFWHATDRAGSPRFLTSYLPGISVLVIFSFYQYKKTFIYKTLLFLILGIGTLSIIYRLVANFKYIPFIIGHESKQEFLLKNLNFNFGDFYDQNGEIQQIVGQNAVLLINMHNLYYINFPFVLSDKDDRWGGEYILIQNSVLPDKFKNARVVYQNPITKVTLYKL